MLILERSCQHGRGSKPMGSHFGIGAPPILVYFSGDCDVQLRVRGFDPWPHGDAGRFSFCILTHVNELSNLVRGPGPSLEEHMNIFGRIETDNDSGSDACEVCGNWFWVKASHHENVLIELWRSDLVRSQTGYPEITTHTCTRKQPVTSAMHRLQKHTFPSHPKKGGLFRSKGWLERMEKESTPRERVSKLSKWVFQSNSREKQNNKHKPPPKKEFLDSPPKKTNNYKKQWILFGLMESAWGQQWGHPRRPATFGLALDETAALTKHSLFAFLLVLAAHFLQISDG